MSSTARSSEWARELLRGRLVWQPLGVMLSLWAWFGWLTPWFAVLLPARRDAPSPTPAVLVMGAALLGHASAAVVSRMSMPRLTAAAGRLVLLLAVLGTAWWAYLGLPVDGAASYGSFRWRAGWVVMLGLVYAWWRAGRLSPAEALEPEATLRRLFAGSLLTAAALALFPEASHAAGGLFLPLYIGGGLAGVALGQVSDATRRRGGRPLPFGLSWHAGLLAGVGMIAVLGVGAGWMLSSEAAWSVAKAIALLLAGAAQGLESLLAPLVEAIFRLVGPILDAFVRMLQSMFEGAKEVEVMIPEPFSLGGGEGAEPGETNQVLAQVGLVLRFVASVLGAAVLLWLAVRTTRRARRPFENGEAEAVEPLTDPTAKGEAGRLRAFLRSALRLPRRARGLYHALLVRRVYAQLLERAASEGRPRRPAETPLEFGAALARLWPWLRWDLDVITRAYLRVRYGEAPEDAEMLRVVQASWDRVRRGPASIRSARRGELSMADGVVSDEAQDPGSMRGDL